MGTDSEMNVINEVYRGIPSILIDYGIVEKRDIVKAISADMGRRLLQSEFGCSYCNLCDLYNNKKLFEKYDCTTSILLLYIIADMWFFCKK